MLRVYSICVDMNTLVIVITEYITKHFSSGYDRTLYVKYEKNCIFQYLHSRIKYSIHVLYLIYCIGMMFMN